MSQQSAKRYGLEVEDNLELENRLRRMEVAIAALQPANQDATATSRGSAAVPQVTGLSLDGTIPGGFTVKWNATTIPDLRKYQVQFATDLAFTEDLQTFTAATISFPFTTAVGTDTSYFCRVRAQNQAGQTGDYSATLNTSTGTVATEDLEDGAVTDPKLEATAVASGLVTGFLTGCNISNAADADHDISFASGAARDSDDSITMTPNSAIVKRIDGVWALGTGNGGLASTASPLAITTWYHCFFLSNVDGTVIDAGFDTSLTATGLLSDSGLVIYRRVGSVLTDASENILAFVQQGDNFFWDIMPSNWAQTGGGNSRHIATVTTPLGLALFARMKATMQDNNGKAVHMLMTRLAGTDSIPSSTLNHLRVNPDGSDNDNDGGSFLILTDTSSQLGWRINTSNSSTTNWGNTEGWVDRRGQDGDA